MAPSAPSPTEISIYSDPQWHPLGLGSVGLFGLAQLGWLFWSRMSFSVLGSTGLSSFGLSYAGLSWILFEYYRKDSERFSKSGLGSTGLS